MVLGMKTSKRIVHKRRDESELVGVHVFRGRPLPMFQPEATSANDILAVAWERDGVHVVRRDLKYVTEDDGSWRAPEKGIDVALAIGVIEAAMNGEFDVVVIFSNDTDQLPTLELAGSGPPGSSERPGGRGSGRRSGRGHSAPGSYTRQDRGEISSNAGRKSHTLSAVPTGSRKSNELWMRLARSSTSQASPRGRAGTSVTGCGQQQPRHDTSGLAAD